MSDAWLKRNATQMRDLMEPPVQLSESLLCS